MDTEIFIQNCLFAIPKPHPLSSLFDLVREYNNCCDVFDEMHCTGRTDKNVPVPNNASEMCIIRKHAKELHDEIIVEVKHRGFNEVDFQKALGLYRGE